MDVMAPSTLSALTEECIQGYEWPLHTRTDTRALVNLADVFSPAELERLHEGASASGPIVVTFLSSEYLGLLDLWVSHCVRLRLRFVVVACDHTTQVVLANRNIPHVRARLNVRASSAPKEFLSRQGFTAKGLSIIGLKYPILAYLLRVGLDVTLCDIDAILLQDPCAHVSNGHDILFQRVAYFPSPLAEVWGFAACSGYVFFRHSHATLAFVDDLLQMQGRVASDQIALNLSLLRCGVVWPGPLPPHRLRRDQVMPWFLEHAALNIDGHACGGRLRVRALPHEPFWRHSVLPFNRQSVVVAHPNSAKDCSSKSRVFSALGILPLGAEAPGGTRC